MNDFISRFLATLAALLAFLAVAYVIVHYEIDSTLDRVEVSVDQRLETVTGKMDELSASIKGFSVFGKKK